MKTLAEQLKPLSTLKLVVAYRPGRSGWLNSTTAIIELPRDEYSHLLGKEWFNAQEIPEVDEWFKAQRNRYQPRFDGRYDWSEDNWEVCDTQEEANSWIDYYGGVN